MDWGNLVGVLVGGLITGTASLGVLRRQVDADRRTRRQERLTDLIVDFVEAADEDWQTAEEQHLARMHRDGGGRFNQPPNVEFEREVDGATERMMAANRVTRRHLAKLRILAPALYAPASDLIWRSGPIADHDAEKRRNEAMWAFEEAARKALDVETPPGTQVRIVSRGGGK